MGLRNRQRARRVSVEVVERHNTHLPLTFEDWWLKSDRVKRLAAQEKREAEWNARHPYGDPPWFRGARP